MGKPHVLMIPFPARGHVIPLWELATVLARHGIQITFVNIDIIHARIVDTSSPRIRLVSIPDGLQSHDRLVPGRSLEVWYDSMPQKIEQMIKENSVSEDEKFSCVISDQSFGRIQQVAKKMGIGSVAFLPAAAASLVLGFNIPKMIEDGIVDREGTPLKHETIQFAPGMPNIDASGFTWASTRSLSLQKVIFNIMTQNNETIKSADWIICNSMLDLEPGAFSLAPQIVPIGPLLARNQPGNSAGHFLEHDSTCLEWLDHQPVYSVIYVAFGSTTIFSTSQFQELALGLELTGKPFLWVTRAENSTTGAGNQAFPAGFLKRISSRGLIINEAPQQKVLSHPSIACFLSHCGWNSTVESVSNGVPMLCLPYFADQFMNRSYITDIWKVGLPFVHDDDGIIRKEEIKNKVDQVLGDDTFKQRASQLQKITQASACEGGDSTKNLMNFVKWIHG
ncbi:UDP-glycosyltransferase 83A1-like [Primulina eburnea]|uniref:UDP-glycosyltransferase 83A1-like n=1 Tax=Primulina eburnea TaxID=1245227 RepID=UPI003C6C701B